MKQVKELKTVRFAPKSESGFFTTVTARVNEYFESHGISRYANLEMWIKTTVMLLLYFVPYILMVTGVASGDPWLFFAFWFMMGWGMIGIGTSVMHDASHGTYSSNRRINRLIGSILEIIGGYTPTWKIQHNVLHHTYTNISGLDEDIDSIKLLHFSPQQPRFWYHRYQYIYDSRIFSWVHRRAELPYRASSFYGHLPCTLSRDSSHSQGYSRGFRIALSCAANFPESSHGAW